MARVPFEAGLVVLPEGERDLPKLLGSRCGECGAVFHPPRPVCLSCHGRSLRDAQLSGDGTLYACTHVQMPLRPGRRESRDYWVGHVDLDEGPRVQGLLSADIGEPRIGMRVALGLETLRVEDGGDEIVAHHFRPAGESA
jgi:hypothetical protein